MAPQKKHKMGQAPSSKMGEWEKKTKTKTKYKLGQAQEGFCFNKFGE